MVQERFSKSQSDCGSRAERPEEPHSSQKWGAVESYDFCIDSSYLGLGGTVELIQAMVAHKEHPIPSPTEEDPTMKG